MHQKLLLVTPLVIAGNALPCDNCGETKSHALQDHKDLRHSSLRFPLTSGIHPVIHAGPQDTEDGKGVLDIEYNSGLIERKTHDGYTVYFGEELKGDALIDSYEKHH